MEVVYSPPTDRPCTMRSSVSRTGAAKPEHVVARQDTDQESRHGHRRHRQRERGGAADTVADMAEQRAADRPHHEADGEDAEGGQHLGDLVLLGKEGAADRGGK